MNKKKKIFSEPVSLSLSQTRTIFLGLAFLSFGVPFCLAQPQLLVGTLINAALFSSAVLLPSRFFLPIIFFPSLAVLSRGLIFGPLTPFLFYFIPFIWLGNLILIWIFKRVCSQLGWFLSILLAALLKQALLFSSANLFFRFQLVPRFFLKTMGVSQLVTACLGGLLSWLVLKRLFNERV